MQIIDFVDLKVIPYLALEIEYSNLNEEIKKQHEKKTFEKSYHKCVF